MANNFYWLISITSESARVSLISKTDSQTALLSLGPETALTPGDFDSLIQAVNVSLSSASENYQLPPDSEPNDCAFIVPPGWIGDDGRIYPETLKGLKKLCQSLKLQPMGFISDDDAFVESYESTDSFPSSFVLLHLLSGRFQLSLVYLGQVKKRIEQEFSSDFTPQLLEQALLSLNFDSALPPKIVVFGNYTIPLVEDLKNYNWLAKKDVETFLHLPDVFSVSPEDAQLIFAKTINLQFSPTTTPVEPEVLSPSPPEPEPQPEPQLDQSQLEPKFATEEVVTANELGFSPVSTPTLPKIKFNLPKIKLHFNYLWLLPFALLPLLPLIPIFFAKVNISIYLTPVEIKKDLNLLLDSTANQLTSTTLPSRQQTLSLSVSASQSTTGSREVGEKSRGEITLFNKLDKPQNLSKGLIFTDPNGRKFELATNLQVPGSSFNLDNGTITMGQVKASLIAADIGPEFNIGTNLQLTSTGNGDILAKTTKEFSGGSRQQVAVVSADDRRQLLETAKNQLKEEAKNKIKSQSQSGVVIFDNTAYFDNQLTDYNREVGEVTDSLSVNLSAKVSYLYLDLSAKNQIVDFYLQSDPQFSTYDLSTGRFDFIFTPTSVTETNAKGVFTINAQVNPKLDINTLRQQLARQSYSKVKPIVSQLPKFYNYSIDNNLNLINWYRFLPFDFNRINVIIKN